MHPGTKYTANIIGEILLEESLTIAVAESVTGGYIQNTLTKVPTSNEFFQGGITISNLGEKTRMKNTLSESIAIKMAKQITELFSSSVGVSIAGYDTHVGDHFAYCAIVINGRVAMSKKFRISKRKQSPKAYSDQVLKLILAALKNSKPNL